MEVSGFLVMFLLTLTVILCNALKEHDNGVCRDIIDERIKVKKTYWCKRGRRSKICTREEFTTRSKEEPICCEDWLFQDDKCVPKVISCDPPCHNAQCTNTNNCTCNDGLTPLNKTHCGPPCELYFYNDPADPDLTCRSLCSEPCVFANCTGFNTCSCFPGYEKDTHFQCRPICGTCEFGTCTAPNVCTCNPGYRDNGDGKCRPVCKKCDHGKCVAPDVCDCKEGYMKHKDECRPACDQDCENGHCSSPNECTCANNYTIDSRNKFRCNPICEQKCVNSTCVSPNTCRCDEGFETAENEFTCRPKCDSCENGECIAPNICACNQGHAKNDTGLCQPVCNKICENGHCSSPNECTCANNYTLDSKNKFRCNPICEQKCVNSTCVSPNTCRCDEGFETAENDFTCRPKCDFCENGECIAPNVCACNQGYAKNDTGLCQPVCNKICVNAHCVRPDKCECFPGYQINNDEETCKPVCEDACVNADCISPNKCECQAGYEKSNVSNICKPACDFCSGECVAPNQCRCYEWSNDTCVPTPVLNCKLCEGTCKEETCLCANGTVCQEIDTEAAEVASTPTLAGLQLTWMLGGAIGMLLIVIVVVVMQRMWRKRATFDEKRYTYDQKTQAVDMDTYDSVMYTVPDTFMKKDYRDQDYDEVEPSKVELLPPGIEPEDYVERI